MAFSFLPCSTYHQSKDGDSASFPPCVFRTSTFSLSFRCRISYPRFPPAAKHFHLPASQRTRGKKGPLLPLPPLRSTSFFFPSPPSSLSPSDQGGAPARLDGGRGGRSPFPLLSSFGFGPSLARFPTFRRRRRPSRERERENKRERTAEGGGHLLWRRDRTRTLLPCNAGLFYFGPASFSSSLRPRLFLSPPPSCGPRPKNGIPLLFFYSLSGPLKTKSLQNSRKKKDRKLQNIVQIHQVVQL